MSESGTSLTKDAAISADGDMRLQRIGIVGYAAVLPIAFFLLAGYFRARHLAILSAPRTARVG